MALIRRLCYGDYTWYVGMALHRQFPFLLCRGRPFSDLPLTVFATMYGLRTAYILYLGTGTYTYLSAYVASQCLWNLWPVATKDHTSELVICIFYIPFIIISWCSSIWFEAQIKLISAWALTRGLRVLSCRSMDPPRQEPPLLPDCLLYIFCCWIWIFYSNCCFHN